MKPAVNNHFNWEALLRHIKHKNVIPVIGHGLYRVDVESEGKNNILLYDYLAEKILEECGITRKPGEAHDFLTACFEFLKGEKDGYLTLSDFLKEKLRGVTSIPDNSLLKLARIKSFDMFINMGYDDLLSDVIRTVRSIPKNVRSYTVKEKDFALLNDNLFTSLKDSQCTLVYHILGNLDNSRPSYTGSDILETILEFHKDMLEAPQNNLFQALKSSSFLFIGYNFDDWLLRFFIRVLTDKSYDSFPEDQLFKLFVENNIKIKKSKNKSWQEISLFVSDYGIEVFDSTNASEFIDLLFEKFGKEHSEEIIQPFDYPCTAFISFEGRDRPAAQLLAKNLKKEGISVWLDEREFKGGDSIDEKIITAINRCLIFIPLVSSNTKKISAGRGKLKYHIQEWQLAYTNIKDYEKKIEIIPVIIDDTKWKYDKFKSIFHLNIPAGARKGDYKKLREQLLDIQQNKK